ncbi:hypothetical protein FRC07_010547 [Ceratobasidium sp. 392]|nr:hypothetical protein FRC07_010547 [Ceratobasidium sp. 392]
MLDEKAEKSRNLGRMKAAYKAGLHGDAPEVLHGTASGLIEDPEGKVEEDSKSIKRKAAPDEVDKKRTKTRNGKSQKNNLNGYMRRK